jgi:septum site-determining protein MinD
LMIVVNKTPLVFNVDEVRKRVENTYQCPVAAVLPHSDEMMVLASSGIFTQTYPDHPLSIAMQRVAAELVA